MTDYFCEHFKAKSDSCNQHISNQILQFIGRQLAKDFLDRSGFKDTPQVLMNGVPIESKSLNGEDFEEAIMMGAYAWDEHAAEGCLQEHLNW